MGREAHATGVGGGDHGRMRHPELLAAFCAAFAVELAHLRWILLTQWKCRGCGDAHIHCECKPAWVRILL
jgi:hypothetical protein